MRKLVAAVFMVALLASVASAYEYTIGGQLGFGYNKDEVGSVTSKTTNFTIAPEFGKIIDEDTNVGIGLIYDYSKVDAGTSVKTTTIGIYAFGEKAVLNPGPFKVFLRGELGYDSTKIDGVSDRTNEINFSILPNLQYALNDRLTLIVSSDVLRLSLGYSKTGDNKTTGFGFNAGNGNIAAVGLKYAF